MGPITVRHSWETVQDSKLVLFPADLKSVKDLKATSHSTAKIAIVQDGTSIPIGNRLVDFLSIFTYGRFVHKYTVQTSPAEPWTEINSLILIGVARGAGAHAQDENSTNGEGLNLGEGSLQFVRRHYM